MDQSIWPRISLVSGVLTLKTQLVLELVRIVQTNKEN